MKDEIKEIKLEKRKPTFDYILNDMAFDSLMFRVVNGIGSSQDKFDFDYQVKLMQKEISRLRKIYKNTYNRLFQNGNDELARYFQAQIDDCPTFYVEPIIDYVSIVKKLDKLIEQYSQNDYYYKYNGKYLKSEIIDDLKKLKEGK